MNNNNDNNDINRERALLQILDEKSIVKLHLQTNLNEQALHKAMADLKLHLTIQQGIFIITVYAILKFLG